MQVVPLQVVPLPVIQRVPLRRAESAAAAEARTRVDRPTAGLPNGGRPTTLAGRPLQVVYGGSSHCESSGDCGSCALRVPFQGAESAFKVARAKVAGDQPLGKKSGFKRSLT